MSNLPAKVINTPLQDLFIEALFSPEIKGDIRAAMRKAGYADSTQIRQVVAPLKEQIIERAQLELALNVGKAVSGLISAIDEPSKMGTNSKIKASEALLDRVGIIKKEPDTVKIPRGAIFFLPKKKNEIIEAEYEIIDNDED